MRVAFDTTAVISGSGGIARYVAQLAQAIDPEGVELRRYAVGRSTFSLPPQTRHVRLPARVLGASWRRFGWPALENFVGDADVVHATGMLTPIARAPLVVTVHDLAAIHRPDLHPPRHVRQQQDQLRAARHAAAVLAVSQSTADDLIHAGVAPERLTVTALGATPLPAGDPPARIDGPYLLAVGETSPRKNYETLFRALRLMGPDARLVVVGPAGGDEQRLRALVDSLGVAARVIRLQRVSDAGLGRLYQDACVLCFPSLAEGFGLPVLEAMAAGVAVLASDIPVLRELGAGAAEYLPPRDEQAWAEAMLALLADDRRRQALGDAGRRRASFFTWQRTAAGTLAGYRLAMAAA